MADSGIVVKGGNETALYLKNFEPEIFNVLNKSVKDILKRTKKSAEGRYPDGAWTTIFGVANKWPSGEIRTAGGSSVGAKSWADAPAGAKAAIFDKYGSRTAIAAMASSQARATGESLMKRYGRSQRFLWPAWLGNRDESMRGIDRAFDEAERKLQSKLDGA